VPTSKGGTASHAKPVDERAPEWEDSATNDERDLSWSAVLKRTFEEYIRGERPNMYGEWLVWE
jgi:WD repeat and SOF domain-containing protein 1